MGVTADTTPRSDAAAPAVSRGRRAAAAVLALALAVPLLGLAAPRMMAALGALPHKAVVDAVKRRQPVGSAALEQAWAGLGAVPFAELYPEIRLDRSLIGLNLLALPDVAPERAAAIRAASIADLRGALADQPLSPFAWLRLAHLQLPVDQAAALAALRLSTTLAVYEPRLFFSRLDLWFRLWPRLTDDDRRLVERQLVLAWRDDPAALSRLAQRHRMLFAVRRLLERAVPDPAELDSHFPVPVRRD